MSSKMPDTLKWTLPLQLTEKIHREIIPSRLSPTIPTNSQRNKIVVITGGGSGIGAAAASVWARAEAQAIILVGRDIQSLETTAGDIGRLSSSIIITHSADIKDFSQVERVFTSIKQSFGRPADVVIACAGICGPVMKSADEEVANWWNVFETNVLGTHNTARAWIRSQQHPPTGTIIHINSGLAALVVDGFSAYSTAKLAAQRYMEYLQAEYPTVRCFSVLPGIVKTKMMIKEFEYYAKDNPELTGSLCLYLASSRSDPFRGSVVSVNWDLDELESNKYLVEDGLLKMKWLPTLPRT